MGYKVGDIVTIRRDLVDGRTYGINNFTKHMNHMLGLTTKITHVNPNRIGLYAVEGDDIFNYTEEMFEQTKETIFHPNHYSGNIETIEFIEDKLTPEQVEGFCIGNVIKYVSRYQKKNGIDDLKKAQWYLNYVIAKMDAK